MKRYPVQPFPIQKVNRELDLDPPPLKKAKKEKRLSWMKKILLKKGKKGSRKSVRKKTSKDNLWRAIKSDQADFACISANKHAACERKDRISKNENTTMIPASEHTAKISAASDNVAT